MTGWEQNALKKQVDHRQIEYKNATIYFSGEKWDEPFDDYPLPG